jgi:tellurite resistance protein
MWSYTNSIFIKGQSHDLYHGGQKLEWRIGIEEIIETQPSFGAFLQAAINFTHKNSSSTYDIALKTTVL